MAAAARSLQLSVRCEGPLDPRLRQEVRRRNEAIMRNKTQQRKQEWEQWEEQAQREAAQRRQQGTPAPQRQRPLPAPPAQPPQAMPSTQQGRGEQLQQFADQQGRQQVTGGQESAAMQARRQAAQAPSFAPLDAQGVRAKAVSDDLAMQRKAEWAAWAEQAQREQVARQQQGALAEPRQLGPAAGSRAQEPFFEEGSSSSSWTNSPQRQLAPVPPRLRPEQQAAYAAANQEVERQQREREQQFADVQARMQQRIAERRRKAGRWMGGEPGASSLQAAAQAQQGQPAPAAAEPSLGALARSGLQRKVAQFAEVTNFLRRSQDARGAGFSWGRRDQQPLPPLPPPPQRLESSSSSSSPVGGDANWEVAQPQGLEAASSPPRAPPPQPQQKPQGSPQAGPPSRSQAGPGGQPSAAVPGADDGQLDW